MAEELILTQEGYDAIVAEHEYLTGTKRHEVSERIKEAISYGDLSENAEYDAAKNEQAEMESRIFELENQMRIARIIDEKEVSIKTANVGLFIKLKDMDRDETVVYKLVGTSEADPFCGKISNTSPIGEALMGKKKGEEVEAAAPNGTRHFKIMGIYKEDPQKKK